MPDGINEPPDATTTPVELNRCAVGIIALAPPHAGPGSPGSSSLARGLRKTTALAQLFKLHIKQKLCPAAQFNEIVSGRPTLAWAEAMGASARRIQPSSLFGSVLKSPMITKGRSCTSLAV